MSRIMEKTLVSIPKLLTESLIGGSGPKSMNAEHPKPAMEVQTFMKAVQRAKSKSHEMEIVKSELHNIQQKLKQTQITSNPATVRSSFTKVLFCHLLGYQVSSIAIHAINLAQQGRGYYKHLGYLISCLLLDQQHEMVILIMSTLLRDLTSSNMSDNCIAFKVAGELVNGDIMPTILPEVVKKFNHQNDLVKEKAFHCFCSFYRQWPDIVRSELVQLAVHLSSRDPGVLMAVTNVFASLSEDSLAPFKGLGFCFLHIFNQINSRGFGSTYSYHLVSLPWLQISLLRLLGNIGRLDTNLSDELIPVLKSRIEITKVAEPISLALLVECIITATKLPLNESLLQYCSLCIMKLLSSDSNEDVRYQGLGLLIALSRVKPALVVQHQKVVVECLTSKDDAIQSRTTILLHAMANKANVKAICSKLFEQIDQVSELSNHRFKQNIFNMISDLAERYITKLDLYIDIYLRLLSLDSTQSQKNDVVSLVLKKVEQIVSDDSNSLKVIVEITLALFEKHHYIDIQFSLAVQILNLIAPILTKDFCAEQILVVFSECITSSNEMKNSNIYSQCAIYPPNFFSSKTKGDTFYGLYDNLINLKLHFITTVSKLVVCGHINPDVILSLLHKIDYKHTIHNSYIKTALDELFYLIRDSKDFETSSLIFSNNGYKFDFSLSFLDNFVVKDLLKNGMCYQPQYLEKINRLADLQSSTSDSHSQVLDNDNDRDMSNNDIDQSTLVTSSASVVSGRKMRGHNKWRDEGEGDTDEESNLSGQSKLTDSFELAGEESDESKKAVQDLFAGLGGENCDNNNSGTCDMIFPSTSLDSYYKQPTRGTTIWDDDEEEGVFDYAGNVNQHSGLNVGKISIHPFGISSNSSKKSHSNRFDKWKMENFEESFGDNSCDKKKLNLQEFGNLSLDSSTLNNSECVDGLSMYNTLENQNETMHSLLVNPSNSNTPDPMWSNSNVSEDISTTRFPSREKKANVFMEDVMVDSAVDALTDSDPEDIVC